MGRHGSSLPRVSFVFCGCFFVRVKMVNYLQFLSFFFVGNIAFVKTSSPFECSFVESLHAQTVYDISMSPCCPGFSTCTYDTSHSPPSKTVWIGGVMVKLPPTCYPLCRFLKIVSLIYIDMCNKVALC